MAKGKAPPIALSRIQRRALENLRIKLEEFSNEHTRLFGQYSVVKGKVSQMDESYYMPLLKLKAILLAADGLRNSEISKLLEISDKSIGRWRNDFNYILSREDLPFERIINYFWFAYNPVENILLGIEPWRGKPFA